MSEVQASVEEAWLDGFIRELQETIRSVPGNVNVSTRLNQYHLHVVLNLGVMTSHELLGYKRIEETLQPLPSHPLQDHLYLLTIVNLLLFHIRTNDFIEAKNYIIIAASILEKLPDEHNLKSSGTENASQICNLVMLDRLLISYSFWKYFTPEKDYGVIAFHVVPAIRAILLVITSIKPEVMGENHMEMLIELPQMLNQLLVLRRFKQLDHCLAFCVSLVLRLHLQALDHQKKSYQNVIGGFSNVYALWGLRMIDFSILAMRGKPMEQKIDNASFYEIGNSASPDIEPYLNQFPIEVVKSKADMKEIHSKAVKWNQNSMNWIQSAEELQEAKQVQQFLLQYEKILK